MKDWKFGAFSLYFFLFFCLKMLAAGPEKGPVGFSTAKPWTYWWWPGSAVSESGLRFQMEAFAKAGIGGLHIIPIYGAKGYESQFLPYLSKEWKQKFDFVLKEAKRLGLGIDMTLGTGWPFGGPQIKAEHAAKNYQIQTIPLIKGEALPQIPQTFKGNAMSARVAAVLFDGDTFLGDVASWSPAQQSAFKAPSNQTKVYLVFQGFTGQKVKRAAPGAEGWVMDHFDAKAFSHYAATFETLLKERQGPLRAIYNDSYEVYGANFTPNLWKAFEDMHGYDLRHHLNVLAKEKVESPEEHQIWADYHRLLDALLKQNFVQAFHAFAQKHQVKSRNQSHGSPGNLIDLYAEVDIPETEFFGSKPYAIPGYEQDPDYDSLRFGFPDLRNLKLASSAAHLMGKPLVSAETATWLGNHFKVSLAQVKPIVDEVFLGGVNHLFFHGTTYSPPEVPWPGWLFYASTNFNQNSHFWEALPALNAYIERCQTALQQSRSDADILLYFPMEDIWHQRNGNGKMHLLDLHANSRDWMQQTDFGRWAHLFQSQGLQADYISDALLAKLQPKPNKTWVAPSGQVYKILLLPAVHYLSLSSLQRLSSWVKQGMPVYFLEHPPLHWNTYAFDEQQQQTWEEALQPLWLRVIRDPREVLKKHGVLQEESLSSQGLSFFRKKAQGFPLYFLANAQQQFQAGWVRFASSAPAYDLEDPMTGKHQTLLADPKRGIWLELPPGTSLLVRAKPANKGWLRSKETISKRFEAQISGPVSLALAAPGQAWSSPKILDSLAYWTQDSSTKDFWGKGLYRIPLRVDSSALTKARYLNLDGLKDWAQVKLNGVSLGWVWALPRRIAIPPNLLRLDNVLELEVGHRSANRIRAYEREGKPWKNFYEINFVDIQYRPFDARAWATMPAGIQGPIYFSP